MIAEWMKRQWEKEDQERRRREGRTRSYTEAWEEGRAQGLIEGRAQERGAWQYWYQLLQKWEQRRAATEREGKGFYDPRPDPPGSD